MNYYSNYTREYVQDICDAINELDEDNNKPLSPDDFRSLTNFLQLFVLKSYERFTFLNSKGLVNRGRCPYTGVPIENTSYKWTYMKSRSIYVSREGLKIMKREDDEDFSRVMGHPPSKAQSGGCYIATTCYGDDTHQKFSH